MQEDEDTGARQYKIATGNLLKHDVGVVLRMPDEDDLVNHFFEVGSMDAPRKVGSTFELAAEKVQYILMECIAKDAAREAAESKAAASTCETASVMDMLTPG